MLEQAARGILGQTSYSCGAAPLWDSQAFREAVLARSLDSVAQQPAPKVTLKALNESLALVQVQLKTLFDSEAAAERAIEIRWI